MTPNIFFKDVCQGLSQKEKQIPCKYFYDRRGMYLFNRICDCRDYYVTRTEMEIMLENAKKIGKAIGSQSLIIEYGSGASLKTQLLLSNLQNTAGYIPIDICGDALAQTKNIFGHLYPGLQVIPVCADFTKPFKQPSIKGSFRRKVIYFPGSTLGNFTFYEAVHLLLGMRQRLRKRDYVIVGIDLVKHKDVLWRAYNDREGWTRAFNLNLLQRINAELQGDFKLERFRHNAFYNEHLSRVEMHLVSTRRQTVHIRGKEFSFNSGESIHTESSYKYHMGDFVQLTANARFLLKKFWRDPNEYFAIALLQAA